MSIFVDSRHGIFDSQDAVSGNVERVLITQWQIIPHRWKSVGPFDTHPVFRLQAIIDPLDAFVPGAVDVEFQEASRYRQ